MNKSVKRFLALSMSALTAFSLVACGGGGGGGGEGGQQYDTETRPIVFSTESLDGNFNPFFSTSLTDSEMVGMTQISMLGTDELGNPTCGMDEPVAVRSYTKTMRLADGTTETLNSSDAAYTDYAFVIKNGLKFSDGTPLTIKDVLFNLYVYLDPAYMGSATIYSTSIVGLNAYRTQDPDKNDNATTSSSLATFYAAADTRIQSILEYLDKADTLQPTTQIAADIKTIQAEFKKEVEADWSLYAGPLENYEDEYRFTEEWQAYLYNEGLIEHWVVQGQPQKDENGRYYTSLDAESDNYNPADAQVIAAAQADQSRIDAYKNDGVADEDIPDFIARDAAIEYVYSSLSGETNVSQVADILMYRSTGSTIRDKFAAEAQSEYYESLKNNDGSLAVPTISGITTSKTTVDGAEHDVLNIRINKVDPKAIWNFAFTVAPMNYYSDTNTDSTYYNKAINDTGSIVNGIPNQYTNFGVNFGDEGFFGEDVLQDPDKNGKPVGAGPYMATNENGNPASTNKDNFYKNNWVYFERNENFYTVFGNDTSKNAKIKYFRYRVVSSDKIMNALQTNTIDVGEPTASIDNINLLSNSNMEHLNYKTWKTNGYGYVGVNPKHVPDIEVRRAIMMAMNTASIVENYYTERLAEVIYRPMSSTSWAYPDVDSLPSEVKFTADTEAIKEMVLSSGNWVLNSNQKFVNKRTGATLKLTFTIAGQSEDHPAFDMFTDAANTLNSIGFDITVATDISALKKLASGQLAVWAAAWSSTVDPDMYQVYHKDSNATSTNNWGYKEIYDQNNAAQLGEEREIVDALSIIIENARKTDDQAKRKEEYAKALNLVMQLAVELPTYQRCDCVVYNKNLIDAASLNQRPSAYSGVVDKVWEINYN